MKGLAVLVVEWYGKVLVGRCYRSGEDGGPGSPGDDGAVTIRTEELDMPEEGRYTEALRRNAKNGSACDRRNRFFTGLGQ